MKIHRIAPVLLLLFCSMCASASTDLTAVELKCEYKTNPLGIDVKQPRLSWILESDVRQQEQTAYQILVASTPKKLKKGQADLWNSGKVLSNQSIQVIYNGKELKSGNRCFWKVKTWDKDNQPSKWSPTASWEMGLLSENDWQGCWINDGKPVPDKDEDFYKDDPAPLFRKTFKVNKSIEYARLYITGLGYYESFLNGERVGDLQLDPGWTNYSKRILYSTFDITDNLKKGTNCIGVTVGNGWYNPLPLRMWGRYNLREYLPTGRPAFLAQLNIVYKDGSTQSIYTDTSWKVHEGPILKNSIYLGEVYDARKEIPRWHQAKLDDHDWNTSTKAPQPAGKLQAQFQPAIRETKIINPVTITEPNTGTFIYDMGQNFAGWTRLKIKAPEGTRITLRYGELLNQDGTLNPMTSVCGQIKGTREDGTSIGGPGAPPIAVQKNTYIAKGKGTETYTPRFTWQAFRYVEVSGYPGKPPHDMIQGIRLNADVQPVGSFSCSNDLLNQIQQITQWTFLSNLFSVQSDCPHRERFGYGGDLAVTSDAFMMNYDMSQFYVKSVRDWSDAALNDGMFTDTAPFVGIQYCGIGWAMAHPLLLQQLYQYYGDRHIIEEQYQYAAKWFDLVQSTEPNYIITHGLADHETLEAVPENNGAMLTPFYYKSAVMMAQLASILQKDEGAKKYNALAANIKDAYNAAFLNTESGIYAAGTQGNQSFPLYFGLVPPEQAPDALKHLVDDIVVNHQDHLTTGIFGTKYMLDVLSKNGSAQTAFEIVSQRDFPGWGNMIENGATTLWEHWQYSDNTFSHNHPMFGSVSEWFYKHVAGIDIAPDAIGFDKFIISPKLVSTLDWAKASYQSVRGSIEVYWQRKDTALKLDITIPIGSTATVFIPADNMNSVLESKKPAQTAQGIQFIRYEKNIAVYSVQSGSYHFTSTLPNYQLDNQKP